MANPQRDQTLFGILFNVMVGFVGGAILLKVVPRMIGTILRIVGPALIKDVVGAVVLGMLADRAADAVSENGEARHSTIIEP